MQQIPALHGDILYTVTNLFVNDKEITADKGKLKKSRYQCTDTGTFNPHLRESKLTENKYIVKENIYFIIFHVCINISVCCFCSGFG